MFIAHEMQPRLFIKNETIIYQGDVGEEAFIIYEGKVQIIILTTSTSDLKDDIDNEIKLNKFV